MVQAFSNSPVDGNSGIQLHLDVGNLYGGALVIRNGPRSTDGGQHRRHGRRWHADPRAGNTVIDWDGATGSAGHVLLCAEGTTSIVGVERPAAVFRYAMFGHQTNRRVPSTTARAGGRGSPGQRLLRDPGRAPRSQHPRRHHRHDMLGQTPTDSIDNDGDGAIDEDPRTPPTTTATAFRDRHDGDGMAVIWRHGGR